MIKFLFILAATIVAAFFCVVYGIIIVANIAENYGVRDWFLTSDISMIQFGLVGFVVTSSILSTIYFSVSAATEILKRMNKKYNVFDDEINGDSK